MPDVSRHCGRWIGWFYKVRHYLQSKSLLALHYALIYFSWCIVWFSTYISNLQKRPLSPKLKVGTHEGACSRSTLLQHAPGAKLPRLHQRFLAKKYVAQQKFSSRVLLPYIKLVWYEGASSRGKSVARVCFRSKLPRVYWNLLAVTWRVPSWPIKLAYFFHSQQFPCPNRVVSSFSSLVVSFVCTGWGTYPGACFRSKLPRVYRPLHSKWTTFQEHPRSKLSQNPLGDVSRLLVMYKDCLKSFFFYHLAEFDPFGYLSWKLKCPKILRNDVFISEIASWTLPPKNFQPNHLLIGNC